MYTIWIEFDLGQQNFVFTSASKARDWIDAAVKNNKDLLEDFPNGFYTLEEEGLCGIKQAFVDPIYIPYCKD